MNMVCSSIKGELSSCFLIFILLRPIFVCSKGSKTVHSLAWLKSVMLLWNGSLSLGLWMITWESAWSLEELAVEWWRATLGTGDKLRGVVQTEPEAKDLLGVVAMYWLLLAGDSFGKLPLFVDRLLNGGDSIMYGVANVSICTRRPAPLGRNPLFKPVP